MEHTEKYLFDLRGYLVVRNAITPAQIADLSDRLEGQRARRDQAHFGSDRTELTGDAWSAESLISWGGSYVDLIDLPTIAPYLETLLGRNYRLDHDYINILNRSRPGKLYLHGGGQGAGGTTDLVGPTDGGQCFYRYNNGRFYNGLVAVAFELDDVATGDGGFACVPGSHKVNFELPSDWKLSASQADIPECVDRVAVNAGDAIIFTEACAHGTVPWEGENERRTVFYKYCPHAVAWGPCFYNADDYPGLTDKQRELLMPPSAFGPDQRTAAVWSRMQAERQELMALREEVAGYRAGPKADGTRQR